jgi:hypothetical protein
MDECPERAPARWVRRRGVVRYSDEVAERLIARVAAGAVFYEVCREPGMPTSQTIGRWAKSRPEFGERFRAARAAGGRDVRGGGVWTWCEEAADAIFERLCEGESLTRICADPSMPSLSTVFNWRGGVEGFEARVQTAMRIRAERLGDLGWELAMEAVPETAYLTHVRLAQLRWWTGVLAPRQFRPKLVEPPAPVEPPKRLLFRHFQVEEDAATGTKRVVAFCPNPDTGQVEREDAPGWRQAPDTLSLPGGRTGGQGR